MVPSGHSLLSASDRFRYYMRLLHHRRRIPSVRKIRRLRRYESGGDFLYDGLLHPR